MEENTTTGAEALAEGVKGRADAGAVRPADYASLDDDPAAGLPPPAINDIDLVVDVPVQVTRAWPGENADSEPSRLILWFGHRT